jgi:threonine 3-dehydrogenase
MSGHPSQLSLACQVVRPGGRLSLLGVYSEVSQSVNVNDLIFKGIDIHAIVGRRLWETWDQMSNLLESGKLILDPVVTHVMHYTQFQDAMELMKAGKAGKVVFTFA